MSASGNFKAASGLHGHRWTAQALRRMPAARRNAILAAGAAKAEAEYRRNPALTAFEAFDKDHLHGDDVYRPKGV